VFSALGFPWGILVLFAAIPLIFVAAVLVGFRAISHRRAKRFGYPSTGAYLRAAPRTDEEKRDTADLTLKGLVICLLGVVFPPFILVGLVPLFYGGRKLVYAWMGLGLVDDPDLPHA